MVREKGPRLVRKAMMAAVAASLLAASSAAADYHLVMVKEVSGATAANDDAYIELQMYKPGQTQLAGHKIQIWDESGVVGGMFIPIATIPLTGANPTNGQNQRTILIGDTNVPDTDFTVPELGTYLDPDSPGDVVNAGAICFEAIPIDCVSWGGSNFSAQSRIPDHSAPYFTALPTDFSLRRQINKGCITALDRFDDTDDNSADFVQGNRDPTPNSTAPFEGVCPPCGGIEATIYGTVGADNITGTTKRDIVLALGGNDTVRGLAGNDVLCGGFGNDTLIGGGGRDRLLGQGGRRDICKGGPKRDRARKCEVKRAI